MRNSPRRFVLNLPLIPFGMLTSKVIHEHPSGAREHAIGGF
jgi:hypothetical protein